MRALRREIDARGLRPPPLKKRTIGPEIYAHLTVLATAANSGDGNRDDDDDEMKDAVRCGSSSSSSSGSGVMSVAAALVEALQRTSAKKTKQQQHQPHANAATGTPLLLRHWERMGAATRRHAAMAECGDDAGAIMADLLEHLTSFAPRRPPPPPPYPPAVEGTTRSISSVRTTA